jgi:hypothetical protein
MRTVFSNSFLHSSCLRKSKGIAKGEIEFAVDPRRKYLQVMEFALTVGHGEVDCTKNLHE